MKQVDNPEFADYLFLNSCGFIQAAKEESIEAILQLALVKNSNHRHRRLLVTGCLAQRYSNELLNEIPEVDGILGIDQLNQASTLLDNNSVFITKPPDIYKESDVVQVVRKRSFAYLKIADGCDYGCSFCAIPMMRGRYRSRTLEAISTDVDRLLDTGVIEFNLIAQDVAYYGRDIGKHPNDLLRMLEDKRG